MEKGKGADKCRQEPKLSGKSWFDKPESYQDQTRKTGKDFYND